jgi:predicted TIM-barrel fold metal-dependent hydrolase
MDYLRHEAGPKLVEQWTSRVRHFGESSFAKLDATGRREQRIGQQPWWMMGTNSELDTATSFIPRLMHERLPEMGIDFAVLYPSASQLFAPYLNDEELRIAGCRALNRYAAETWAPYADRATPIGVIPMHTPQEAVAELEHCKSLGLKAVALGSLVRRAIPAAEKQGVSRRYAFWCDVLALDSEYDYDPVWRKCEELGYPATFHSAAENMGLRNSLTNFVYNHIGHFGEAGNAVCKALFLGGVTRRFPRMRFAFLEGGVAWGCSVFADLISHWEKRNGKVIHKLNPAHLNRAKLHEYINQYGGDDMARRWPEFEEELRRGMGTAVPDELDDFAACKIEKKEDIRDLFVPNFFFGCESDDPTLNYAFAAKMNPFGAKLGAILSSDISHFDVPDMTEVLEEAWELVEEKGMAEEDFQAFTFGNAVKLWASLNPNFFTGTIVESQVRKLQAQTKQV